MKSIFVICLAVTHILLLLIVNIYCSNLGLINPIEVVEEWGCHDTEIRLTCGHLDSKLAVLEATFTPNCTDEDCINPTIKRFTGGYHRSTSKSIIDPVAIETEAARKFLETLKQTHNQDDDNIESYNTNDDESSALIEMEEQKQMLENNEEVLKQSPLADALIANKKKRTSLRTSLERLIERYLQKLSPNNNNRDCNLVKRSARLKREKHVHERKNHKSERIILGARNVIINESISRSSTDNKNNEEMYRRLHESRTFCSEQRHRISSLDKFHLEHSYKNDSKGEFNIRKTLNRRCSGKNHCSFMFALDDPYSKVWDSGIVRIKYLCMEDFRINRYCNEHLTINHEIDLKLTSAQDVKGEPVAEARIQLQDQSFHSLKILKSDDETKSFPEFESIYQKSNSRKHDAKEEASIEQERKRTQGIYSRDFKILKILPNNIEDFDSIDRMGDEIYIRTDNTLYGRQTDLEQKKSKLNSTATTFTVPILSSKYSKTDFFKIQENNFNPTASTVKSEHNVQVKEIPTVQNKTENKQNKISEAEFIHQNFSKFDNITIIIREGEQYVVKFRNQPKIVDNLAINEPTIPSSISSTISSYPASITKSNATKATLTSENSVEDLPIFEINEKNENTTVLLVPTVIKNVVPVPTNSEMDVSDLIVEASNHNYKKINSGDDNDDLGSTQFTYSEENINTEEDNEFMNFDGVYDGVQKYNFNSNNNKVIYNSIQKVSHRKPLLHGFLMSPGYPKFYVGNWECKSVISAPNGQKIRITILDMSIRYDEECKDFLKIVDLEYSHTLFNSCTEAIRPIEIISISNQIEVIMKTTSKFAFPKRGVLIHYSALGCIDLPPPRNGYLVEKKNNIAVYECDPSFVFPDTGIGRRQLECTERNTWDKILPNCIEVLTIIGSEIISGLNLNSRRKPSIQEVPIISEEMPTGPENQISNKMKDTNQVTDVIVPLFLIGALFIINGIVFYYIRLYRKRQSTQEVESRELAEL